MSLWEEIINTAIIGTDKKQINTSVMPTDLANALEQAKHLSTDKETQFLNSAAILYNYRRASFLPATQVGSVLNECENEQQAYCSLSAAGALQATIDDENRSLLFYWLTKCHEKNLIVTPEYIPYLFQKAERDEELRDLIILCCGQRGKWMAQFNTAWLFNEEKSTQTIFDHGRLEERKKALTEWRAINPLEARLALEKCWTQEQAATKAELLEALEINLQIEDEVFLKECWKEKSQKVKEVTLKLLKQLPTSFIVNEVWEFVVPLVSYKKSSSMLGLLNKENIELNLEFTIPDSFKSYGISHIDANKIYTEKEFTLSQLIGIVPLSNWENHFNLNADAILSLFEKKEETKKFISSFATAANTFKNVEWAKILYQRFHMLCFSVVKEFDEELQEQIVLADLQYVKDIYQIFGIRKKEWNLKFVMALIEKTSQEPYSYTKAFYKNIIHHLPTTVIEKLDNITVEDQSRNAYWETIKDEIKKMLTIKQQINQSF
jgi:hypothetical protein